MNGRSSTGLCGEQKHEHPLNHIALLDGWIYMFAIQIHPPRHRMHLANTNINTVVLTFSSCNILAGEKANIRLRL